MSPTRIYSKHVVGVNCLALFFANFERKHIAELKTKSRKFLIAWNALLLHRANFKGEKVSSSDFWTLYTGLDFEAQALILQKAFELYEEEVLKKFTN